MDILFVAINAKFIHTSPAVRILNKVASQKFTSTFIESGIKDKTDHIVSQILEYQPKIVGFSCYIWNIKQVLLIAELLKKQCPEIVILLGGPEVSYDCSHFINYPQVDYIISNEAEEVLNPFIDAVLNHCDFSNFEGVATKSKLNTRSYCVNNLNNVPSIIDTYEEDDLKNRIIYYETSRGCPFNCSYCLSSVQKGVRVFPLSKIISEVDELINKGATNIKFLDRTFNFNPKRFLELVKFLERYKGKLTFQFEITLELFTEELMDYFTNKVTPSLFRFEIGIQSIYDSVNKEIDRHQNKEKLFAYIKRLINGKRVILHLDLIAGLPLETYLMFQETLNQTIRLLPHELQLGFLKMLRGTKIRNDASKYHYVYEEEPPYEVIENMYISKEELTKIHLVEQSLDIYYNSNRASELIKYLLINNLITSPFIFFLELGERLKNKKIYDAYDYYVILIDYLNKIAIDDDKIKDIIVYSYLTNYPIRPKHLYKSTYDYDEIYLYLKSIHKELQKSHKLFINKYQDGYIVLHYLDNKINFYYLVKENNKFVKCELLYVYSNLKKGEK
jgi:radical SAM superfamily enzyme YgiQ (UPF0313 family)